MKNNRKGFTITELVIVIAVIAILAAVLIPTFSGIIKKAQDSAALQEARNIYTIYLAQVNAQPKGDVTIKVDNKYFAVKNGELAAEGSPKVPTAGILVKNEDDNPDKVEAKCAASCTETENDADTVCDICGTCVIHKYDKDATSPTGKCEVCEHECEHEGVAAEPVCPTCGKTTPTAA